MDNVIIYDAIDGILNECETVWGGVLNIQSNVTILQNDVTNLKNIPMIANQSAVRTSP